MNAFVMAGDRGESRQIYGMNKAFLPLEGKPLFLYVLMALDRASGVDRIYVVGPRREIMEAIERALPDVLFRKKIEVLEQKNSLLENILYAYSYSLPGYREGIDARQLRHSDPPALFLPSDIPLVSSAEIEEFIRNSDMGRYDYCMGVTSEEALTPYYPQDDQPGMKMAYLYLKEKSYRMNNLHLARPFRVGAGGLIQKMYDHRYQRYTGNRLRIVLEIFKTSGWVRGLSLYLLAQAGAIFSQIGVTSMVSFFRRFLPVERVEEAVSRFLRTRFKAVETHVGGAALDIDDEVAYQIISSRFQEWRERLGPLDRRREDLPLGPLKKEACG